METSTSPPRNSISSWWSNFKQRHSSNESLSIYTSNETPSKQGGTANTSPKRPQMRPKSRSSNYIPYRLSLHRNSKELDLSDEAKLKQHRNSFLNSRQQDFFEDSQVFAVPLKQSLEIASAKINCGSSDYGLIPVVIAQCGIYIKKNGLDVEGIFRVAGSSRRVKELQFVFSTAPLYGRKIDWESYGTTVHDAASLMRRYLNFLPEPLVSLALYEQFRDPIRSRPRILNYLKNKSEKKDKEKSPEQEGEKDQQDREQTGVQAQSEQESKQQAKDIDEQNEEYKAKEAKKAANEKKLKKSILAALKEYALLFNYLPKESRHLILYILDLLSLCTQHRDKNLMTAKNLAAVFQPSILTHPDHDMSPEEYALSHAVLEIWIEFSYILIARLNDSPQEIIRLTDMKGTKPDTIPSVTTSTDSTFLAPPPGQHRRQHSRSLSSVVPVNDRIYQNKQKPQLLDEQLQETTPEPQNDKESDDV
ncbi:hypothetical protein LJB42_001327 [Komagataella kurtzmanii]|nr:hypothetical protein LJB42_001327 [Komagataella kurtzmanii]